MSERFATVLQTFPGIIAGTIAAGLLAAAFQIGADNAPKEPPKPKCEVQKDPKSGMDMYNPDCVPARK